MDWTLHCDVCDVDWPADEVRYRCSCGGTLDVKHPFGDRALPSLDALDARRASRNAVDRSGVWRFREWILPLDEAHIVTRGEGNTHLYRAPERLAQWVGLENLWLKHEGENPTGSFKDRGMTAGVSVARWLGMQDVACASTGNTSASLASYAAIAGMRAWVFVPEGRVAFGKLAQALAYGATTLSVRGDFDDAMRLVQDVCADEGIYLLNSVNPYRIEGQKAIGLEILQDLGWRVPDWIFVPGGNLGNNAAIARALLDLRDHGFGDRVPQISVVQAAGANPLARAWRSGAAIEALRADTLATAIRIGDPVSAHRSLRGLRQTNGRVDDVTDDEILDAKAHVDAAGIGAEPASCASVAGLRKAVLAGEVDRDAEVVCVLTGHVLKDPGLVVDYHMSQLDGHPTPFANAPIPVDATPSAVRDAIRRARGA